MSSSKNIRQVLESPLVTWAQTFDRHYTLDYDSVIDGIYVHEVMCHIDPRAKADAIHQVVEESSDRLLNWEIILKNIKSYYEDVLQQLIIMPLPNVMTISRSPDSDSAHDEIKKFLLLILGCAVQCERKGEFIDNIKQLDIETQAAIVECIKEITDDKKNVCTVDTASPGVTDDTKNLYNQLKSILRERDIYIEEIKDLTQSLDHCHEQLEAAQKAAGTINLNGPLMTSPKTQEKHHLGVELADCKAKIRRLRQEIEDKNEVTQELRDEIEDLNVTMTKLRNENLALSQDARSARAYRDEFDALKEKAHRAERHESEINKYKEKLNELEFYKSRVEELRADNLVVCETKEMLEEQLEASNKRIESVIELENELMKYKKQLEEFTSARDHDREQIQTLMSENARLHLEVKGHLNDSSNLEHELQSSIKDNGAGASGSLSDQLGETVNTKLLRLELENQRLQKKLHEKHDLENAHNTELEKENRRLGKKIEKFQETQVKESEEILRLETEQHEFLKEREQLAQAIETVKESASRQVRELEMENQYLNQSLQTIRERNEKTNDIRLQELERDNKRMDKTVKDLTNNLSTLDFDHRKLQKSYEKLQENVSKISELEQNRDALEKRNAELNRTVQALKLTCDNYETLEQNMSDLEVENQKLVNNVQSLKSVISELEKFEQDCVTLTMENQKLQRTCENLKKSATRVVELEHEKGELSSEIQHLKKTIKNQISQKSKYEQIEIDTLDVDNENQKLMKNLQLITKRAEQLQTDNDDLECENEKLLKSLETVKLSVRKLEDLEKLNREYEIEMGNLQKQKMALEREVKKLKQSNEVKESSLDEMNAKVALLERENADMKKVVDFQTDTTSRVKELETENRELVQNLTVDKKTLTKLREDLVNEKVKCQQMDNELQKLSCNLDKIGLKKESLLQTEVEAEGENRMKALETLMEDVLKKSLETREEKIQVLELRLEESKLRNTKLQEEVKQNRVQMELFREEMEEMQVPEMVDQQNNHGSRISVTGMPTSPEHACKQGRVKTSVNFTPTRNTPSEFLMIRGHLVEVERNNAALTTENTIMKKSMQNLENRCQNLETKANTLQNHKTELQMSSSNLQAQIAKLQVENSTLESQNYTLQSQTETLRALQVDHESLVCRHEELQNAHESLVGDHEMLQQLHEQLSAEYETLISEHGNLKSAHKILKQDYKELNEKYQRLLREKEYIERLRITVEQDQHKLRTDSKNLGTLQEDYVNTREELTRVNDNYDKLNGDYVDLMKQYKNMKTSYNALQLKNTELQGDMAEYRDQMNSMDVEISKLMNKNEALESLNTQLAEENKSLIRQLQTLLTQNHELITQTLESKDQFYEEERSYLEKLSDLRRQKEKLEEKIMEQYKNKDPPKKNRSFGAHLVKKARGFIAKRNRAGSKSDLNSSPDQSICDPANESFSSSETASRKFSDPNYRSSQDLTTSSPKLSKQRKHLSSSTNAVNLLGKKEPNEGFKSSEDLLDEGSNTVPSKKKSRTSRKDDKISQKSESSTSAVSTPALPAKKLIPGSMSIYDRSPNTSPRNSTASLLSMMEFLDDISTRSPASRRKLVKKELDKKEEAEPMKVTPTTPNKPDIVASPRSDTISERSDTSPNRRQLPQVPHSPVGSMRSQQSNESPPRPKPDLVPDRRHSTFAPPKSVNESSTLGRRYSASQSVAYKPPTFDTSFTSLPGTSTLPSTSTPMVRLSNHQPPPPPVRARVRQRPASARLVREPNSPAPDKQTTHDGPDAGGGDARYSRRALSPPPLPSRSGSVSGDNYGTVERRQLPRQPPPVIMTKSLSSGSKPPLPMAQENRAHYTTNNLASHAPPLPPPRKRIGSNPNLLDDEPTPAPAVIRQLVRPASAHASLRPSISHSSRTSLATVVQQSSDTEITKDNPPDSSATAVPSNREQTNNNGVDESGKPKKNSIWYEYGCV